MKFKVEVDIDWVGGSYQDEYGEYHSEEMSVDDVVKNQIVNKISNQISGKISKTIIDSVTTKINYSIDSLIDNTLKDFLDRKIKITDKWGTVISEYEDVEEMLKEKFDEFITQPVDSKGRPKKDVCTVNGQDDSRLSKMLDDKIKYKKKEIENFIDKKAKIIAKQTKEEMENYMNEELQAELAVKMKNLIKKGE